MRCHSSTLISRLIRAALRVHHCRYRVACAGLDYRGRIISIATNTPKYPTRGDHAEERLMRTSPRSLSRIVIIRVNAKGDLLPIDPCKVCQSIAHKLGIKIERGMIQ
jgi:hypothetical protein